MAIYIQGCRGLLLSHMCKSNHLALSSLHFATCSFTVTLICFPSRTKDALEDYLFAAEEITAYLLENALALPNPDFREKEIRTFAENLLRVIRFVRRKKGIGRK